VLLFRLSAHYTYIHQSPPHALLLVYNYNERLNSTTDLNYYARLKVDPSLSSSLSICLSHLARALAMCKRHDHVFVRDEDTEPCTCHLIAFDFTTSPESPASIRNNAGIASNVIVTQQWESLPHSLSMAHFRALCRIDSTNFYEAADQSIRYIE
jgi:hypothetical protein